MFAGLRRIFLGALMCWLAIIVQAADRPSIPAQAAKLNNLGVAYMNQQRMDKAVEEFDAAIKADPSLATAQLNKGIALLNLQKLAEAKLALDDAAAKEPNNPRVWYNLGLLHRGEGKTQEAIDDFQRVVKLDPKDPDAHYFLGTFYTQLQQYDKAIAQFQEALKLNPVHASAEFGLARAYQRSGNTEAAHHHLQIFEHLTRDHISSAMTLNYGEQGRYSTAQDVITSEPQVSEMIPISLVPQQVGSASPLKLTADQAKVSQLPGSGLCLIDLDGDGKLDIVALGESPETIRAFRNLGDGRWKRLDDQDTGLRASGTGISCAVGDYDNDGRNDLAISLGNQFVLFHNDGNGKFHDATESAGIKLPNNQVARGLTFVDYDHDGDLDLLMTGFKSIGGTQESVKPNVLFRNNGNGTFTNWTIQTGVGGEPPSTEAAMLSDINNDRAVDLVVTGSAKSPTVYLNQREGPFQALPLYDPSLGLPPTIGVYVFDFDKDGWMDVAVTHSGAPGVTLWRNIEGQRFERVPLPINDATRGWGVTSVDIDNDGWLDLAVVVETARGPQIHVLRNRGPQGFEDVSAKLGLDKVKIAHPRSIVAADMYDSNASDLVVSQLGGDPIILRNQGGNKNHGLRLNFKGLADNKTALGTKVEVFAGGLWQKWEIAGGSGYLSQGAPEILAGLGSADHVDIVRMLWPTGVLQDEIDIATNKPASFTELDRRGSSCPTLFAWNGEKYEFISDVIGAGVMGHWISPTAKNTPRPEEWIKIDGFQLQARRGYFSLRFGEPMEEVNFVDQLRLVAVDHPEGTDVYPDERFLNDPPFASGKPVLTSSPHPPAGAWDDKGRDVLAVLSVPDHQYVRDFTNLQYAGFANLHTLTLDLGAWSPQNPLRLFLTGFIEYFSATSMYAAWQAGLQPISPYVEAQLPDGTWKRVIADMGFPAGLPRTITVDLTGKLPTGARRIRIVTNLQIYWDQLLVDNGPDHSDSVRTTELLLSAATLGFRGYPQQVDGATTPGDLTYHYETASETGPFAHERGSYTHYGDVTSLLTNTDNHFVIFGTGEDIDAEFSAAAMPTLPPGWKRDYFFYANGYVKDMDFYEATPFTVADMPFHGMTTYPYPASQQYPADALATRYRLDWNDRYESGANDATAYRFQYRPRTIDPEPLTPNTLPRGQSNSAGVHGSL